MTGTVGGIREVRKAVKHSLRSKLMLLVLGVLSLVTVSIVALLAWLNTETEGQRLQQMEAQVRQNIADKAKVLVDSHALALRGLVLDNAFTDVRSLIGRVVASDADVIYGVFVSADGTAWAYASPTTADANGKELEGTLESWKELGLPNDSWKSGASTEAIGYRFGAELLEVSRPVVDEGEVLGVVRYGFSTSPLGKALARVRADSAQALHQLLGGIVVVALTLTALGFVLVTRIASRVTRPLEALTEATSRITSGAEGVRVEVLTNDELGLLARAFNDMQAANEDAMRRVHDAMQAALESARLKSEFLANMSHEIRTPMNGVIGMTRLMLAMPLEGKLKRYAETVDTSAAALMTIINDVLDFSKMEAGKYTLQSTPFDPDSVVQEAAELLSARAAEKHVDFVYRKAPDVPLLAMGDPDRFRQILNNLIGNAIKFTDEGEIFVELTMDATTDEGHVLRVLVQDTGIGIGDGDMDKLFDAFSQADGSLVRKHGGTGLGLAISKRLVEMMGGQIGVSSERGVGSKFWFTMCLGEAPSVESPSLSRFPEGRRALVVERSRRWCRVIREHFTVWGLQCEVMHDGRSALDSLRGAKTSSYDLAVVGAHLRDMTVESFVKELRSIDATKTIPVIVLTQFGALTSLTEIEQDISAQVAKPLRFSELYESIVRAFVGTGLPAPAERREALIQPKRGKRILVVDDNEINQFVAMEQIEAAGFEVELASNGAEAVEKVKTGDYAVVLMDCQMPIMDGYTAAATIREWEGDRRHMPIVALTAHAMVGEREKVLAAGMDDYLSKPLRARSLERLLERYISPDNGDAPGSETASEAPVDLKTTIARSPKRSRRSPPGAEPSAAPK